MQTFPFFLRQPSLLAVEPSCTIPALIGALKPCIIRISSRRAFVWYRSLFRAILARWADGLLVAGRATAAIESWRASAFGLNQTICITIPTCKDMDSLIAHAISIWCTCDTFAMYMQALSFKNACCATKSTSQDI